MMTPEERELLDAISAEERRVERIYLGTLVIAIVLALIAIIVVILV